MGLTSGKGRTLGTFPNSGIPIAIIIPAIKSSSIKCGKLIFMFQADLILPVAGESIG